MFHKDQLKQNMNVHVCAFRCHVYDSAINICSWNDIGSMGTVLTFPGCFHPDLLGHVQN